MWLSDARVLGCYVRFIHYLIQLLLFVEIWKFGWIDGLFIDSRMKTFWGKISTSGGAGGANPEEQVRV